MRHRSITNFEYRMSNIKYRSAHRSWTSQFDIRYSTFAIRVWPCHVGNSFVSKSRWVLSWAFLWPYKGVPFPLMNAWVTILIVTTRHHDRNREPTIEATSLLAAGTARRPGRMTNELPNCQAFTLGET